MLVTTNPQRTLWETLLPPGYEELPAGLAAVDALLDDPVFFEPYRAHFSPLWGRPSIPIETYLRMMFLKHRYRLGYESLCREVADSISWSRFCRIPLGCRVPHPSTLEKVTTRCGRDVVDELNAALLVKADAAKVVKTDKVRADTTVVAANVRYPTDSGLLVRAIVRIVALVARIHAAGAASRTKMRDRRRSATRRAHSIGAHLRMRTEEAKGTVLAITGELAELAAASITEATAVATNARRHVARRGAAAPGRLVAALNELDTILDRAGRVVAQTRTRLAGDPVDAASRVVSLHDPDARPIKKGRLGKPVEFGCKGAGARQRRRDRAGPQRAPGQPAGRAAARPGDPPDRPAARPGAGRGRRRPWLRRGEGGGRAARARHEEECHSPQGQAVGRPPRRRARPRLPPAGQVAHRLGGPDLPSEAPLRLGPQPARRAARHRHLVRIRRAGPQHGQDRDVGAGRPGHADRPGGYRTANRASQPAIGPGAASDRPSRRPRATLRAQTLNPLPAPSPPIRHALRTSRTWEEPRGSRKSGDGTGEGDRHHP